jgi:uncharacterized membrane protein YeaQ/YmgE (transglycosylase-associated protein family)
MTRSPKTILAVVGLLAGLLTSTLHAAPTQEDVFKSISDNMSQKQDGGQLLAVLAAIAGAAVLFAVINKHRQRDKGPKALNHQGKLLKEVLRATTLRPAEARLLKSLAESQSLDNGLVLLLCPSVLEKALREKNGKVERKVAVQLARKAGLIPTRTK